MNHLPELWGRPRDDFYGSYNPAYLQTTGPVSHTQSPLVTGTSVIAVKYKDGVVIAADNLASYGSLAKYDDVKRLRAFNSKICVGFGGDVSDMQHIDRMLQTLAIRENYLGQSNLSSLEDATVSPHDLDAKNLHMYLSKVLYKRRSEMNPLWNVILIAGLDGADKPYLASVDLLGTTFTSPTIASGYGAHLAVPILRRKVPDEEAATQLSKEDAVELIRECMKVLFYRDARSLDKYTLAVVSKGATEVEMHGEEKVANQSWAFAERVRGYGAQVN